MTVSSALGKKCGLACQVWLYYDNVFNNILVQRQGLEMFLRAIKALKSLMCFRSDSDL